MIYIGKFNNMENSISKCIAYFELLSFFPNSEICVNISRDENGKFKYIS